MAIKKSIICGKCRSLIIGEAKGNCPTCGKPFDGNEAGVPLNAEMEMKSLRPSQEELDKLTNEPFKRKPLSGGEAKKGIRNTLLGIFIPPLMVLFGLWVIKTFRGPGVILFGFGSVIAAPVFAVVLIVMGLQLLFRDPRKKSAETAIKWIWYDSYKDALTGPIDAFHKNTGYAYGSVIRCVPNIISEKIESHILKNYLQKFRNTIEKTLDEKSSSIDSTCKWKNGTSTGTWNSKLEFQDNSIHVDSIMEDKGSFKEITYSFKIEKVLYQVSGEDTYELHAAAAVVKINGHYIKNGKYWFAYDLMPEFV